MNSSTPTSRFVVWCAVPDLTITLTDAQMKALRKLDAAKTAKQVMQTHVDTWLAPFVADLVETERKAVVTAYQSAAPAVRASVKELLGLG